MKTLALNQLSPDTKRTQSWLLNKLKQSFYANFDNLNGGQIIFQDHQYSRQCGTDSSLIVTIVIRDDRAFSEVAFGGAIGAAEAYMDGLWTCDELSELVGLLLRNREVLNGLGKSAIKKPIHRLLHWLNRDTEAGARRNIAAHYDLGNDLFKLFLDPTMTYSAGYFETENHSMEQASTAKLDRICKKLDLKQSDHVLEIGSGWGSFAIHAASRYGCRVTTTTISDAQHAYALDRIREAGLTGQIELLRHDYRRLEGRYDKLVSIEMIEAVGLEFIGTYFRKCSDLLKPAGKMLIQAITIADQQFEQARNDTDFIQQYIFPGGALPSVTSLTESATKHSSLRMVALEDMTEHYARTLVHWRERFYRNVDSISRLGYDNRFLKMWEYYLCYCEGGFNEKAIGCIQAEFEKPA